MLLGLLNWELIFIRLKLLIGEFPDCDSSIQAFFDDEFRTNVSAADAAFSTNGIFISYVLTIMPHIISSRVTQYQAQAITDVTICQKFINSLMILLSCLSCKELRGMEQVGIGHCLFLPAPPLPHLL